MCCPHEGRYQNFGGTVEIHMEEPWYNIKDVLRILRRIRGLDYAKPETRRQVLCMLNGLECCAPFGSTTRFPPADSYIAGTQGCFGVLLKKLKERLVDNCLVRFEIGEKAPSCGRRALPRACVNDNTHEDCQYRECFPPSRPACYKPLPCNTCPITSDDCPKCLGPEPPLCCPEWEGQIIIRKVRPHSYKCYLKTFDDLIKAMLKTVQRKEFIFNRKRFENCYKLIWLKEKPVGKPCCIFQHCTDATCDGCCNEYC